MIETRELWYQGAEGRAEAIIGHVYDGVTGVGWIVRMSEMAGGDHPQLAGDAHTMLSAHATVDAILATYAFLLGERLIRLDLGWAGCSCPIPTPMVVPA